MHVALAADGHGIAEASGHPLHRAQDVLLRFLLRASVTQLAQRQGREHGARPGAEVFRGERLPRHLAQVVVHVARGHRALPALPVDVLEQLLARQVLAPLHDPAQTPVLDADLVHLAALPAEAELHRPARDLGVAVAEGGETERPVVARVFLVADANERGLQELDDGGQDAAAREPAVGEVFLEAGTDEGQGLPEGEHAAVFRLVAHGAPPRVIAVLLAAAGIAGRDLDVAEGVRADPHVRPGGRDDERTDAGERAGVAKDASIPPEIAEGATHFLPSQAGPGVGDVTQAGRIRRLLGMFREVQHGLVGLGP
jgi:hypothetical protein